MNRDETHNWRLVGRVGFAIQNHIFLLKGRGISLANIKIEPGL